jgi:nitrogen regulatory protein P-II 1
MRLLKAFVRTDKIDEVIRALKAAAAPGLTVSRVHGVGYGYDPCFTMTPHELPKTQEVAKVEVVCCAGDVDRLLAALMEGARTGCQGDGIVFVTPVERAVRIRTGEEGRSALCA